MDEETNKREELNLGQTLPPRSEFHKKRKRKKKRNYHLLLTNIVFWLFLLFIAFIFIYYLYFN